MVRKITKYFTVFFSFFLAIAGLSFSLPASAFAATSYSTPVTVTGDPDTSSIYDLQLTWNSLANSINPTSVSELTTYNGATYDYLYTANLDFPFTFTFPYSDYGSFLITNTFSVVPQLSSNFRVIGYEYEILNDDPYLKFQLRTTNTPGRFMLRLMASDYSFARSKSLYFIVRVKLIFDRADSSHVYSTVPQSVGSCYLNSYSSYLTGSYKHGDEFSTSLYKIISDAIDLSPNLLEALAWLELISDDVDLLNSVLSNVQTLNSKFDQFYSLLSSYNATGSQNTSSLQYFDSVRVYLQRLVASISGWSSNTATTPAALASLTFDRWVLIISTALGNQAPDATEASQNRDNVQGLTNTQHAQESAVFQSAQDDLQAVDFNINFPSGVVSTAVSLMGLTALIWERLGDFQFIAIATLSAGLIVVLLGVINRFNRSGGGRSSRPNNRAGS